MTVLERMDEFCRWAFLDRFVLDPRPRLLRWLPLFALAAVVAGYALMMAFEATHLPRQLFGGAFLFFGGNLAAVFMRLLGPRMASTGAHSLDERELIVKARASAMSGTFLSVLAMGGCFYMAFAGQFGLWRPESILAWIYLGLGLQSFTIVLPTLFASWLQPRPDTEEE